MHFVAQVQDSWVPVFYWALVLVALGAGAVPGLSYIEVALAGARVQDGVEIGACGLFRRSLRGG